MTLPRSDVPAPFTTGVSGGPAKPESRHLLGLTLACIGCCSVPASAIQAGPLADPTRPPSALMAPGGLAAAALSPDANLSTARAIAAAARAAEPPMPATPALVQAVQLPVGGGASALVDGRSVRLGDLLDGRVVLAIDAQGLLVKGASGPERLWLLGGTPKQTAGSITGTASARYQAAPATAAEGSAAHSAERNSASGGQTNNNATQPPLSMARRSTP